MSATVQATFDLARRFRQEEKYDTALHLLEVCLETHPKSGAIWDQYGRVLYEQEKYAASVIAFQKAMALEETDNSRTALAEALARVRRYEEATRCRAPLLPRNPTNVDMWRAQARDLRNGRMNREVIELVDAHEAAETPHPKLQLQRALARLILDDYTTGFADYESRIEAEGLTWSGVRAPKWAGEDLTAKSILVMPEQGFGDAILTARFLPALKARGAHVSMFVKPPLRRLFGGLRGLDEMVETDAPPDSYDYFSPVFSLPHQLGTTPETVPPPAQLVIPQDSRARAHKRLAPHGNDFKIGIVWTGTERLPFNKARRIDLPEYARLAALPGVQLFSLYKGPAIGQLKEHGLRNTIVDAGSSDRDFADTAGLIEQMDLMVTCDTAVVHVAASLGKPVWNLMPTEGFWFYGSGDTTPWYPSMRLYRQTRTGDWSPVFRRIEQDVMPLIAQKRARVLAAGEKTGQPETQTG